MVDTEALAARSIDILARLVAFDTTSRGSNLALIAYVESELSRLGVVGRRVPNLDGTKCNLFATLGPMVEGGVVLSGHTDVVPVDGQAWSSDPFVLTRRGERLFGRGTCDMKGFLALALAAAPELAKASLVRPVHLAFSYDEEVGCLGAPAMIETIARDLPRPAAVIVGEPTNMEAVRGHKGISVYKVTVSGHEAHSSLTHLGVSAVMAAVRLMSPLCELAGRLERDADPDCPFSPKGASLSIGLVQGGTATNILARQCTFWFDLRTPPGLDHEEVLADFFETAAALNNELRTLAPEAGVRIEHRSSTPALAPELDGEAERLARFLTGDNGPARVVSYAAEAGQFQGAGFSTVICGPGSIDQAHQPDEFVEISQIQRGAQFMARLVEAMSR